MGKNLIQIDQLEVGCRIIYQFPNPKYVLFKAKVCGVSCIGES